MTEDWHLEIDATGLKAAPVDVKPYARLLKPTEPSNLLLISATLTPWQVERLGWRDVKYLNGNSHFPPERRRIFSAPSVRVNFNTAPEELSKWIAVIDRFIEARLHQKGIIHSANYKYMNLILKNSKHRRFMLGHESGELEIAVARFKASQAPCILVSPSVTTGFDFPHDECRWQIIAKMPFPYLGDRLTKRRMDVDTRYSHMLAANTLTQAYGRAVRDATDWADTFVADDNVQWWMRKYHDLVPQYLRDAWQELPELPPPMAF